MASTHPDEGLERGLSGAYEIRIGDILREAASLMAGSKRYFVLWSLLVAGLSSAVVLLLAPPATPGSVSLGATLMSAAVISPFLSGMLMLGARRAAALPIGHSTVMRYSQHTIAAFVFLAVGVLVGLPGLLGIVAAFGYNLFASQTIYLIADRQLGLVEAVRVSFRAVSHRWPTLAALQILQFLIIVAGGMLAGIGLIWAIPLVGIASGIVYREMFGVKEADETVQPSPPG